jgi:chromosome segregation ATPase
VENERLERVEKNLDKLTDILMGVLDSIKRLERVAGVLLVTDEELDRRLTEMEGKSRRIQ